MGCTSVQKDQCQPHSSGMGRHRLSQRLIRFRVPFLGRPRFALVGVANSTMAYASFSGRSAAYRSRISSHLSLPLSLPLSLYIYISSPLSFLANYLVHRSGSPAAAYPLSMSSLACNIFMCLSQALCFQRQQPGARPPPWVRPPASQNFWRRLPSLTVCSRSIRRSGLVLAKMLSRTSWTLSRRNRLHKRRRQ